ncbi:MAG TPA: hypothetical protein VGO55_14970 [Allosphingosinicella sp.]|jgi:hypothetical protein|nr:hypothetical protein [Allosphingosinicella sp.]
MRIVIAALLAAMIVTPAAGQRSRGRAAPAVRPPAQRQAQPPVPRARGLDDVMGRDARALGALLGNAALDVREGPARKLQFLGPACVLDTYLYPPRGGGEAVVTHVDARLPDGRETDRSACIASLSRR